MAGREHRGDEGGQVGNSLAALLTSIQVDLTSVSGKVDTLNARLEGRLNQQEDELDRQRREHADLKRRVEANTRFRYWLVGIAGGTSFVASLLAQPVGVAIFGG